jgi:cytochrome c556
MIRPISSLLFLMAGLTFAKAQTDVIAQRRAIMKGVGQANADVGKIAKGEAPFDLAKVKALLSAAQEASVKMPGLFPETSKTGDTAALPKVWQTKADFDARWKKLGEDAAALQIAVTDQASFKAKMSDFGKNCGGCHEGYRQKN